MPSSIDTLRALSSRSNVDRLPFLSTHGDGIVKPTDGVVHPNGGMDVTWAAQNPGRNDDALNEQFASSMGGGAAVRALRQALDEGRMQHQTDQRIHDEDQATNGLKRAMTGAKIQNEVGGFLEEGAARNAEQPFLRQAADRTQSNKLAQLKTQFVEPAALHAQGVVGAAEAEGQWRQKALSQIEAESAARARGTVSGKTEGAAPPWYSSIFSGIFGGGQSATPPSSIGGLQQSLAGSGGMIRARDPQGVLHEAPAGTALPAGWTLEK